MTCYATDIIWSNKFHMMFRVSAYDCTPKPHALGCSRGPAPVRRRSRVTGSWGASAMLADPLPGETVGETAYRRIRSDILFGRLAPGEKLKLDRISEAYSVSIS